MNGKVFDLLIDDVFIANPKTGIEEFWRLSIWADPGMKDIIESVEGVAKVIVDMPVCYWVYLDPRYDREFVKAEIEAAIKCA